MGTRDLAKIPPPRRTGFVTIRFLFTREEVRSLFSRLGADPDAIPDGDYLTEDDFFETPDGKAHWVAMRNEQNLDDLLYRDPSGDDPGGWLRRPLNNDAKARGLTRAKNWRDVVS